MTFDTNIALENLDRFESSVEINQFWTGFVTSSYGPVVGIIFAANKYKRL